MKLEKKNLTMEEFLNSLDMTNLKTMIENDSDYGDEADMGAAVANEKVVSQSATSINCSQSAQSNNAINAVALATIKSPKNNNYIRPTFQI